MAEANLAPEADPSSAFLHLARRAEEFVEGRGGVAPEDMLIRHVFGTGNQPDLWRSLLRRALAASDRLAIRADGCWTIPSMLSFAAEGDPLGSFVALDVETTGLHPARDRIVEVAVVRFDGGAVSERYESLVNPGRRLPKYVAELTKLHDADLAEAPPFADVVAQLLEMLGEHLIVGHNVAFDVSFVNAELQRIGMPLLVNERLDTMGLVGRLMPQVRRPSLDAVAERLGVPGRQRNVHRAGIDALITGQVALRLAQYAQEAGHRTFDEIKAIGTPMPKKPSRHAMAWTQLDKRMLADIPKLPGVYLMKNADGAIIYVGKAKCLRDRVGSYFSQRLGQSRKTDGLLGSIASIETVVVGSELEALLLETQFIRRYRPRYNSQLKGHERYPFIRLDTANAWPRISLARARGSDGATYFGPFRSSTAARRTVDLLNRVVPLRTCTRSFKDARSYGNPCIELDLGRCLGPCTGKVERDAYWRVVHEVRDFLDGRDEALYDMLLARLEDAATNLDFERAERLRREIRQVATVVSSQRRLREAVERATCLVILPSAEPDAREILLVHAGRAWAQVRARDAEGPDMLAGRLLRCWQRLTAAGTLRLDHDSVDEAYLLHRWLSHATGTPGMIAVGDDPDWADLAARALGIPLASLPGDYAALGVAEAEIDAALAEEVDAEAETDALDRRAQDSAGS